VEGPFPFSPGGAESNPDGITITPDGTVWYSESDVKPNTMVRFDPETETFAKADNPSRGWCSAEYGRQEGGVHIACSGVDKVGVVQPRFITAVGADCVFGDAGYQEADS
jgi:virginiamycin B lyase